MWRSGPGPVQVQASDITSGVTSYDTPLYDFVINIQSVKHQTSHDNMSIKSETITKTFKTFQAADPNRSGLSGSDIYLLDFEALKQNCDCYHPLCFHPYLC